MMMCFVLCDDCSSLIIPLINEVLKENDIGKKERKRRRISKVYIREHRMR